MTIGHERTAPPRALLEVRGLSKDYVSGNTTVSAIERLDFEVLDGEFVSIVGPSGCGKTTLLKCMSGLLKPTSGKTLIGGREVVEPPESLATVFQDYRNSLFPWASVSTNVELPIRHLKRSERKQRVGESLAAVGMTRVAQQYPWQLSGGMQQRIAIARAIAYQPSVLLLDEPFASVDAQTRADLEDLVLTVCAKYSITAILVTHDIDEAVYMGDRVLVLSAPPCHLKREIGVELPNPREQVATKEEPMFAKYRSEIYRLIKE